MVNNPGYNWNSHPKCGGCSQSWWPPIPANLSRFPHFSGDRETAEEYTTKSEMSSRLYSNCVMSNGEEDPFQWFWSISWCWDHWEGSLGHWEGGAEHLLSGPSVRVLAVWSVNRRCQESPQYSGQNCKDSRREAALHFSCLLDITRKPHPVVTPFWMKNRPKTFWVSWLSWTFSLVNRWI